MWRIPLFSWNLKIYVVKNGLNESMFQINDGYLLAFNCLKYRLYWFFKNGEINPGYRHKINLLPLFLLINISVVAYLIAFNALIYKIFNGFLKRELRVAQSKLWVTAHTPWNIIE